MSISLQDVHSLPIFPSSSTLRSLHPSHQASVLDKLQSVLQAAIALPDDHLSRISCSDFISTYVEGCARDQLQSLVFAGHEAPPSKAMADVAIRKYVFSLALRLSTLPNAGSLSLSMLQDICVVYGAQNSRRMATLISSASKQNRSILRDLQHLLIPTYASVIVSQGVGLHGIRKVSLCLQRFLQCSPPEVLDEFVQSPDFVVAVSRCYDSRLSELAATYGGFNFDDAVESDTTVMWLQTKVSLLESFNIIITHLLEGHNSDPVRYSERILSVLAATVGASASQALSNATPFLNRSLLMDYEDAYNLSGSLTSAFANIADPRRDVVQAALTSHRASSSRRPGALRVLLRSSGGAPGIDYGGSKVNGTDSAFVPTSATLENDPALDSKISTVLEILPDQSPEYIKCLLSLPQYTGNAEQVIAALLEGDAPPASSIQIEIQLATSSPSDALPERRNVFNDVPIDASAVSIGKRRADADTLIQDRAFIDQMKADILRRAAELSESDSAGSDSDDDDGVDRGGVISNRVFGDGEGSGDDSDDDEGRDKDVQKSPEMICELAYLKDPKLFDRSAETRRSKARADLKTQTGWSDEQLEGWKIMLERDPKKDKILQKHEFSGNRSGRVSPVPGPSNQPIRAESGQRGQRGGRGRGRGGGGGGRGRGRGRGGPGGGGGPTAEERHDRERKEQNKAREGNHNRKRGHDRKMARGGMGGAT